MADANRWFPGDKKHPEFLHGWPELDPEMTLDSLRTLQFNFAGTRSIEMVVQMANGAQELFTFEGVDDVNVDGRIFAGLSTVGVEIESVALVVGSSQKTGEGRSVYCMYFLDAVMTFSSTSMHRAPADD